MLDIQPRLSLPRRLAQESKLPSLSRPSNQLSTFPIWSRNFRSWSTKAVPMNGSALTGRALWSISTTTECPTIRGFKCSSCWRTTWASMPDIREDSAFSREAPQWADKDRRWPSRAGLKNSSSPWSISYEITEWLRAGATRGELSHKWSINN